MKQVESSTGWTALQICQHELEVELSSAFVRFVARVATPGHRTTGSSLLSVGHGDSSLKEYMRCHP